MTKDQFLSALRTHLTGVPTAAADDIVADYASHFDEGLAAGRREEDIAAALGDPARLARELRAQAGLKRWEEERSPSAAAGAILAILSIGAIDLLILLPMLMVAVSLIFALACVAAAFAIAGVFMLLFSPIAILHGHLAQGVLAGLGFLSGGTAMGCLSALASIGLVNFLIRYGRFHLRLIKPITA
ncbi:MAG TPA: DUF1700 domain-containing protein [Caulobacteraceae bacterium]